MNKKIKSKYKATDFREYLNERLKDKEFKKYFDEYGKQLEISYAILKLRKARNMSQSELAKKIGTTQSNIARLEAGRENFTVAFLNKIASALGGKLCVTIHEKEKCAC
ncbi:MAG: helix-turn-helix transcriptional regulator [Patescibacteria group bacterium]|jgi:ribosome-binding protein aMBF1 (putative translation factor)